MLVETGKSLLHQLRCLKESWNYGIVIILECFEVVVSTNTAFCPPLTKCLDCMTLLKHFANGNLRNDAPSKLSFHFLNQNLCYKEKTTGFLQLVYFRSTRFLNRGEEKASQQWVKSYLISFRTFFLTSDIIHCLWELSWTRHFFLIFTYGVSKKCWYCYRNAFIDRLNNCHHSLSRSARRFCVAVKTTTEAC